MSAIATRCLILGLGFGDMLSNEADIQGLRDVAMATNFGTTLAANGLWQEITTCGIRIRMICFQSTPTSVGRLSGFVVAAIGTAPGGRLSDW